jgi:hypothetical protein
MEADLEEDSEVGETFVADSVATVDSVAQGPVLDTKAVGMVSADSLHQMHLLALEVDDLAGIAVLLMVTDEEAEGSNVTQDQPAATVNR